jgi:hypothetical protein
MRAERARLKLYLDRALDSRLREEAGRAKLTIGRYVSHLLENHMDRPPTRAAFSPYAWLGDSRRRAGPWLRLQRSSTVAAIAPASVGPSRA